MITRKTGHNGRGETVAAYGGAADEYRYALATTFDVRQPTQGLDWLVWIMLNPSTATHTRLDPTVSRCMYRAQRMGCKGAVILNLFAWRATDPAEMRARQELAIGEHNDRFIRAVLRRERISFMEPHETIRVVGGWGSHGRFLHRDNHVADVVSSMGHDLYALELNKDGGPKHPLYVPNSQQMTVWRPATGRAKT